MYFLTLYHGFPIFEIHVLIKYFFFKYKMVFSIITKYFLIFEMISEINFSRIIRYTDIQMYEYTKMYIYSGCDLFLNIRVYS